MFRYFSMYSGVGGFEIGIEKAWIEAQGDRQESTSDVVGSSSVHRCELLTDGIKCIGYSEIDKYACQVYRKRFGTEVKNYGTIAER